jgi:hypothetical protein
MTPKRSATLPHLDAERTLEIYRRAPGSEVESEKFNKSGVLGGAGRKQIEFAPPAL